MSIVIASYYDARPGPHLGLILHWNHGYFGAHLVLDKTRDPLKPGQFRTITTPYETSMSASMFIDLSVPLETNQIKGYLQEISWTLIAVLDKSRLSGQHFVLNSLCLLMPDNSIEFIKLNFL